MKSVVVTGVSTGIGHATAKVLLKNGFQVFGNVRKQEDADRLAQEFGGAFIRMLFDVTDEPAVDAAARHVRERLNGETLFGLVNNAGIAVAGPLLHVSSDEIRRQLEVNVVGALMVTQAFTPLLGSDRHLKGRPGRIINIGSISGKIAVPYFGPYTISKFALEGFNDTLRQELLLYGIDVILVAPGHITTPLFDKAVSQESNYLKTDFASSIHQAKVFFQKRWESALPPERVGEVVRRALTEPRPKVRYTVCANTFMDWVLPRLLPKRTVDAFLSKQIGLKPPGGR